MEKVSAARWASFGRSTSAMFIFVVTLKFSFNTLLLVYSVSKYFHSKCNNNFYLGQGGYVFVFIPFFNIFLSLFFLHFHWFPGEYFMTKNPKLGIFTGLIEFKLFGLSGGMCSTECQFKFVSADTEPVTYQVTSRPFNTFNCITSQTSKYLPIIFIMILLQCVSQFGGRIWRPIASHPCNWTVPIGRPNHPMIHCTSVRIYF